MKIFGEDLYERKDLLNIFQEILGYSETKPFECVGTYEEARYAVSLVIESYKGELPYLIKNYKENYPKKLYKTEIQKYNNKNNLTEYYDKLVRRELKKFE